MTQQDLEQLTVNTLDAYGYANSFQGRELLEAGFDIGFKASVQVITEMIKDSEYPKAEIAGLLIRLHT